MAQLGYKPASLARGVGEIGSGASRVTYLGSFAAATWITEVGIRMGRSGASAGFVKVVSYNFTSNSPTSLFFASNTFTVTTFMSNSDRATGVNYAQTGITGLLALAGQQLAAGLFNDGPGSVAYGQDNSGAVMYYETGHAVQNPYNEVSSSPQGNIDVWLIGTTNRTPSTPQIVAPASGEAVVDTTPTIRVRFADPDIALGDFLRKYKIEVWDETNTTRLQQSGVQDADSGMQASGIAEWTVATPLTPGQYWIRANLYDAAAVASPTLQYPFTVNAGGAFTTVLLFGGDRAGTDASGNAVTNSATPRITARWTHDDGESTATVAARIRNLDTDTIYRAEKSAALVIADDVTVTLDFDDLGTTWADMARGSTRYAWELQATDALAGVTGWAQSEPFVVNAAPVISGESPAGGLSTTTRPELRGTVTDATDGAGTHTVVFKVRPDGGSYVDIQGTHIGSGVYRAQPTSLSMPTLDDYEYVIEATDPWGLADTDMVPRTIHYVAPPAFSGLVPADGSTIDNGTPTVSATIDRSISAQRVSIVNATTQAPVYDSGEVTRSGTTVSQAIPPATLPNATDYQLTIWIRATDGLEATSVTTFRVEYEPPAIMPGVAVEAVRSSIFDGPTVFWPEQKPNVRVSWPIVDDAVVPVEDWIGYVIYRIGGDQDRQWSIPDQTQGVWIDTSPQHGVAYDYYVGYSRRINDGLDTIESRLVRHSMAVTLLHTTITSESASDPAVTLHTWRDRGEKLHTDVAIVEILGQEKPDTHHSPLNYDEIDGEFEVLDDTAFAAYTARDIVNAAKTLAKPVRDQEGRYVPRNLYYRDPKGRSIRFVITRFESPDDHRNSLGICQLSGIEVASDSTVPASVNVDDAVDITDGYPLHAPLTVMAAPPTVTVGSAWAASAIPGSVELAKDDPVFTLFGCTTGVGTGFPNDNFVSPLYAGAAITVPAPFGVEFETNAGEFELRMKGNGPTNGYRLTVDGEGLESATGHLGLDPTGDSYLIHYVFPDGPRWRRLRFDFNSGFAFGGIRVPSTATVQATQRALGPKVMLIGDSQAEGTGTATNFTGYGDRLSQMMGWRDLTMSGSGGTGLLNDASGLKLTYGERVQTDVIDHDPAIVLVQLTGNDMAGGFDDSAYVTALADLLDALVTGLPDATIVVIWPWHDNGFPPAELLAMRDIGVAQATAHGLVHIDALGGPIPFSGNTADYADTGWITGTGDAGNPQGDGNADTYISADSTHFSQAGHDYMGQRLAQALRVATPALVQADTFTAPTLAPPPPGPASWVELIEAHGSDLAAWWRFGESSGSTADNAQGDAACDGTITSATLGAAGAISGDSDTAITFDGTSSQVSATVAALGAEYSMECWFYSTRNPDGALLNGYLMVRGIGTAYDGIGIMGTLFGGDEGKVFLANDSAWLRGSTVVTMNVWHHILFTRAAGGVKVYLDGVLEIDDTLGNLYAGSDVVTIGSREDDAWWFQGRIDEPAVYNAVLTAADALEHYQYGIGELP